MSKALVLEVGYVDLVVTAEGSLVYAQDLGNGCMDDGEGALDQAGALQAESCEICRGRYSRGRVRFLSSENWGDFFLRRGLPFSRALSLPATFSNLGMRALQGLRSGE